MNLQQEIDACEQELASLLSRVLESTLDPIKDGLNSLEQQQANLKDQVDSTGATSQQVSEDLLCARQSLNRLISESHETQRNTISKVTTLLENSHATLLDAQAKAQADAYAGLEERLASYAVERTAWLAETLGSAVSQGALQQQRSAEDLRENLLHRMAGLESGSKAIEQNVADMTLRLEQLQQALLRLQQNSHAMQNEITHEQRELTVLCDASSRRSEAAVNKALRSIRQVLAAVFVLALFGTLLATYGQWGIFLK